MFKTRTILSLCTALLAASPLLTSTSRGPEPAEEPTPFEWLVGHWVSEDGEGKAEEIWAPTSGGAMLGMFRMVTGDHPEFYELITIQKGKEGWEMRLRHFHADLRAWEDRDEPLVWHLSHQDESSAVFGPVTYERDGADGLRVLVELEEADEPLEFRFQRAKPAKAAAR